MYHVHCAHREIWTQLFAVNCLFVCTHKIYGTSTKTFEKEKTIQYNAHNSRVSSGRSSISNGTELKFNRFKPFSNVHLFIVVHTGPSCHFLFVSLVFPSFWHRKRRENGERAYEKGMGAKNNEQCSIVCKANRVKSVSH